MTFAAGKFSRQPSCFLLALAAAGIAVSALAPAAWAGFELTPAQTPAPAAKGGAPEGFSPILAPAIRPEQVEAAPLKASPAKPIALDMKPLEKMQAKPLAPMTPPPAPAAGLSKDEMLPFPGIAPAPRMAGTAPVDKVESRKMAPPPGAPVPVAPAAPEPSYAEVHGFGKDMPLALAMRQIVPPDYAFSFGEGADPGARISWNGGAPWDKVLRGALAPSGLGVRIEGRTVLVSAMEGGAPMPAMPAAAELTPSPQPAAPMARPQAPGTQASGAPLSLAPQASAAPALAPASVPTRISPLMKSPAPAELAPRKGVDTETLMPPLADEEDRAALPLPLKSEEESAPVASATASVLPLPVRTPPMREAVAKPPVPVSAEDPALDPVPAKRFDAQEVREWSADAGSTLRKALSRWSREAGVQLYWSSQFDYPIQSDVLLNGTYEKAVATLLDGLRDAQPRPMGRLHPNPPDGPAVLIVEARHIIN